MKLSIKKQTVKKILKWAIPITIILVILIFVAVSCSNTAKKMMASMNQGVSATVERGSIAVNIESTGVIEPLDRYDIVPLVSGKIQSAPYEEGDSVNKGDILYRFDAGEVSSGISKAENSKSKLALSDSVAQQDINDQSVIAAESGTISGLSLRVGDSVPATGGKVCEIHKDRNIVVKLPFSAGQIANISSGQSATLVSADTMGSFGGSVSYVSPGSYAGGDGSVLYDVEITAENPGSIATGDKLVGVVHTGAGDLESPQAGTVDIEKVVPVNATVGGKVTEVLVRDGDIVQKGQKLVQLYDENLYNTQRKNSLDKRDADLSISDAQRKLKDYQIESPISGVVISKKAKAGDNVNSMTGKNVLMTVADMSKMVFNIKIDELDISKVFLGQPVDVTADALPGQRFVGEVTNVAAEGVASNGVTTYEVKVTIDVPGDLKPGMNVSSVIKVDQRDDVLMVPLSAVKKVDGRNVVYVKQGAEDKMDKKDAQPTASAGAKNTPPPGTMEREVEVGINDEENVEILSGLQEGEEIVIDAVMKDAMQQMMGGEPSSNDEGGPDSGTADAGGADGAEVGGSQ